METRVTEIDQDTYQLTTYVAEATSASTSSSWPVTSHLFHTGPRQMFPLVRAVAGPTPESWWITFGHVEADECGSMNDWLGVAPQATVAQGVIGCMVSLNDLADRPPRPLADGEVLDIGGHRFRWIDMPHVPHAWENGIVYDETTRTLFCGDLFTQMGAYAPAASGDIVGPAITAEDVYHAWSLRRIAARRLGWLTTSRRWRRCTVPRPAAMRRAARLADD
jgi:glyoxylase-like metal-dependent hydrolase (beta-lactamase superfamily II)